jgi:hypothetical protein
LRYGLAGGQVIKHDSAFGGRGGGHGDGNRVSGFEGKFAGAEIDCVGGIPFIPGIVGVCGAAATIGNGDVDAGLKDGILVGVAVDANPD